MPRKIYKSYDEIPPLVADYVTECLKKKSIYSLSLDTINNFLDALDKKLENVKEDDSGGWVL